MQSSLDTRPTAAMLSDVAARCIGLDGSDLLRTALDLGLRGRVALVSSFGIESALLLALTLEVDPAIPVIFLDTGRLFDETVEYRDALARHLGIRNLRTVQPDPQRIAAADPEGELWRRDPDGCCGLRKVLPLEHALADVSAWISGRKRFQSTSRAEIPTAEIVDGRLKLNPLAPWSRERLQREFDRRALPRHPLEAQGFPSVGCRPCTAPVASGADPRSGRWPGLEKTECGIHGRIRVPS